MTGLRLAFGLALCGQLLVLLGIFGLLHAPVLIWSAAAAAAAWAYCLRKRQPRLPHAKTLAWSAAALFPFILLALFPPIAFDETLYHLPFVQALARAGRIEFFEHLRFPAFPLLHELLCLPVFLAFGDVATHFVALAEIVVLAVLLAQSSEQKTTGILAAALALGHPIVVQLATVNHVEAALMLFVAAGFVCLDRIDDSPGAAAAAGFFLGTACCVKYLGGFFAVAGLAFLLIFSQEKKRAVWMYLGALAIATLPMYGQLVRLAHNPLFPFATSIFGSSPWALAPHPSTDVTAGERAINALRLFWDITFARERVNQQPPYSPLFAVAFAIVLFSVRRNRRNAFLAAMCVVYIAIITFLPQDSRYLTPLLPLAAIAAAREIAPLLRTRAMAIAAVLLAIAPAYAYAAYRLAKQGIPPITIEHRDAWLAQRVPEYRALQHRRGGITYLCGAEQLQSFASGLRGDFNGPSSWPRIFRSRDAVDLAERLREIRARELLVSRAQCPPDWQALPREPEFRLLYEDSGALLWGVISSTAPTPDNAR
jgi:hypothetical protein